MCASRTVRIHCPCTLAHSSPLLSASRGYLLDPYWLSRSTVPVEELGVLVLEVLVLALLVPVDNSDSSGRLRLFTASSVSGLSGGAVPVEELGVLVLEVLVLALLVPVDSSDSNGRLRLFTASFVSGLSGGLILVEELGVLVLEVLVLALLVPVNSSGSSGSLRHTRRSRVLVLGV
ncbi:unnamed protein product [Closterium sp. NIES-65]|nr:unnamed protein product [Closterium sp. NIES-65]